MVDVLMEKLQENGYKHYDTANYFPRKYFFTCIKALKMYVGTY